MPPSSPIIRRPSLRDLAKELDISHTAVALALRNDTRVSFDVRRQVQALARKRGYFINDIPKNLFDGRSCFVGLVVPDLLDTFYGRLVEGIQDQLWSAGKVPLILSSHSDIAHEEAVLERYARLRADGVILVPAKAPDNHPHFVEILKKTTPLVTVERSIPSVPLHHVAADEAMGVLRATLHLLERGLRHPAFCFSNHDAPEAVQVRRQGYAQVMQRGNFADQVFRINFAQGRAAAIAELSAALGTSRRRKVDSIVAASDDTAIELIQLLRESGRRVPEDVSVIGFGNRGRHRPLGYDGPALSTMDLVPEKIGREAALLILGLSDGRRSQPREVLLEPELIEGGTVISESVKS